MWLVWWSVAHASPALDCEALCRALDDVEERCEAARGDGGFCEDIGTLEETCDPEDGGTTASCPTLCADIDALDDDCDGSLGPSDPVCRDLDALADDCEDGSVDTPPSAGSFGARIGCAVNPSGGASLAWLGLLAVVGRRRVVDASAGRG